MGGGETVGITGEVKTTRMERVDRGGGGGGRGGQEGEREVEKDSSWATTEKETIHTPSFIEMSNVLCVCVYV